MDNILDKFGIYDFFGLLVPGMVFLYALICMDFPLLENLNYPSIDALVVVGFILLSYLCGMIMQEIGSFIDDKFIHMRNKAETNYLEKKNHKCKLLYFFMFTNSFEDKELKSIKQLIYDLVGKDIDKMKDDNKKQQVCKQVFFICKSHLENNDKIGKAEKLNAMFAMSRDLIVCNIGIIVCIGYICLVDCLRNIHWIILIYAVTSSLILIRREKRFIEMRVRTIIRQYIDLNKAKNISNTKEKK